MSDTLPSESPAIESGWAIGLLITSMVAGAALLTATPQTVTIPIATVLGLGAVASAVVAAGRRWSATFRGGERRRE
jgi:hypothetical protein